MSIKASWVTIDLTDNGIATPMNTFKFFTLQSETSNKDFQKRIFRKGWSATIVAFGSIRYVSWIFLFQKRNKKE
ncbi:MAG TPA: hypothetical protein VFO37_03410 [Chitinophagaceae bacterium]|nr:hypothetical protein [Chitinophagaceae bacterium]